MKVNYEKSFLKDVRNINDKKLKKKLKILLEQFEESEDIHLIQNILKEIKEF